MEVEGGVGSVGEGMNVCEAAIDAIERRGWTQGIVEDDDGRICLVGAVNVASRGTATNVKTRHVAIERQRAKALSDIYAEIRANDLVDSSGWITQYNDAPGRTVDEVIEVLRYAAKREAGIR